MTVTLDSPTTSAAIPAPRTSEDDALLDWASNLNYGVRARALALSDMPSKMEDRKALLRWNSVRGVGVVASRHAALMVARWAKQGVERHPDGEMGLWRACFVDRWITRTHEMTPKVNRDLCKPFGGTRRIQAGYGESHSFWMYHPDSKLVDWTSKRLRLLLPAGSVECDSNGTQHFPEKLVIWNEPLEDLVNLAASIEGLALTFRHGSYELKLNGKLLTVPQYRNLHRFL